MLKKGRDILFFIYCLFIYWFIWIYLKHLEKCLKHSRSLTNICWKLTIWYVSSAEDGVLWPSLLPAHYMAAKVTFLFLVKAWTCTSLFLSANLGKTSGPANGSNLYENSFRRLHTTPYSQPLFPNPQTILYSISFTDPQCIKLLGVDITHK